MQIMPTLSGIDRFRSSCNVISGDPERLCWKKVEKKRKNRPWYLGMNLTQKLILKCGVVGRFQSAPHFRMGVWICWIKLQMRRRINSRYTDTITLMAEAFWNGFPPFPTQGFQSRQPLKYTSKSCMQIVMPLQRKHYVVNGFFALMYEPHLSEGLFDQGENWTTISDW